MQATPPWRRRPSPRRFPLPTPYPWSGFYGGVTAGAAFGQYNAQTSTVGGSYMDAASAAAVSAAGAQSIRPTGFTTGIEGGYNWRVGNLLLGVEADLQAVHLNGATNSGAIPYPGTPAGKSFTVTSYGNTNWLFTARPRVGFVAPNHWLFYATGGLALTQLRSDFSFVDSNPTDENVPTSTESGKLDTVKVGYTVGGGVEAPLTDRLNLKAEYLYADFANTAAGGGVQRSRPGPGIHPFRRPEGGYRARWSQLPVRRPRPAVDERHHHAARGAGVESSAAAQQRLGGGDRGCASGSARDVRRGTVVVAVDQNLVSRLIYGGLDALSGETFARADHASGFFVKGYLGAGGIVSGHMNDEDFPATKRRPKPIRTRSQTLREYRLRHDRPRLQCSPNAGRQARAIRRL